MCPFQSKSVDSCKFLQKTFVCLHTMCGLLGTLNVGVRLMTEINVAIALA